MDDASQTRSAQAVEGLVDRLLDSGIDGAGPLSSAAAVARDALASATGEEDAIDRLIRKHVRLAASEGFVTGLGGFITLSVALPANVVAFHLIATRMIAAVAAIRGHDPSSDKVRTAVLLVLAEDDAGDILRRAGVAVGTGRLTAFALRGLPPSALMAVNKGVAFRVLVRLGQRSLSRFGRFVPGIGGLIGGAVDAVLMRRLGRRARAHFPRVESSG